MPLNWEKCPSVMLGGKHYFYYAATDSAHYWATWCRNSAAWVATKRQGAAESGLGAFPSPAKARKACEAQEEGTQ